MRALRAISPLLAALLLSGCFNIQIPSFQVGGGGGWQDVLIDATGAITMQAEHNAVFYAYDTLAYPGQPVDLAAQLLNVRGMDGIPGVTLGFYRDTTLVALGRTDKQGVATVSWTPPGEGDYAFTVKVIALPDGIGEAHRNVDRCTPAPLLVAARRKTADFVVIDLDHTVVGSSFFHVLIGGAKPMPESIRVTKRIAGIYNIVYLTHRPGQLSRKSKSWLKENGFPAGPLLVSDLEEAFGDSGKFKTARLAAMRKSFSNVRVGIGDKLSDAQAYVDNGLTAYLIPHYKAKPKHMRKMAKAVRDLRGRGRLHVVDGWREIETGIFSRKAYPPETFARTLELRTDRLEAEERAKDRDDDDDDDDDDD